MLKSRIVAIALIGIILSSSSISVVDAYTISINVKEINEKLPIINSQQYKIMLYDAVIGKLTDNNYFNTNSYELNLFDGVGIRFSDRNYPVDPGKQTQVITNIFSIELTDGIDAETNYQNNDIRIIKIKQDHDRKALWESIFPLERIKNNIRSLYKEIQNDNILSYVQLSEVYSEEDKIEQFSVLGFEFEQIDKFIGKANYVGDQFGIQWQHLTDVDKFIGKANYVGDQFGIQWQHLTDVDKFIGKANYVGDQFGIQWQHLTDVDKFIGKANYVGIQLAGHAKQLTDPEKFVKKSNFVGKQLTISVYRVVDPNQPTLLVLLIPLASFVLIRSEHENIQFYHIQRFVSIVFIVILVSSVIISPFYLSTLYWGYAFAQEPEDIGPDAAPPSEDIQQQPIEEISVPPPEDEIPLETPVQETPVQETPVQEMPTANDIAVEEPIIHKIEINYTDSHDESFILSENVTFDLHHDTPEPNYNHTVLLNETFNLLSDQITDLQSVLPQNKSTQLSEQLIISDQLISPESEMPESPQDLSNKLFTFGSISDHIINRITDRIIPNATESWQFENNTSDVTFNDDATIDNTEGINGTSLLLDGNLDFVTTNSTNATTYITDMSIAAWVKPNYTNGSPEFTVVSKGKSFVLSINNIIEPYRIAKFSIFDGIKWTTVQSSVTIPDDSWTHLVARFNKTAIQIYVNGTLQNTVSHNGVPYVSERGQIEIKTLPEITSYYDIVIGASVTPNMASDAYNMFSGMIDGVQLYDHKLLPEDVMEIFQNTIPIKSPIIPPEPVSRPEPALRYRIVNSSEIPVAVSVPELDDTDNLTVSVVITPNYTGGSPEFTILSRENSFVLSLNKMMPPEKMAKFSVYDGISWHTVTGSTPINGTTHVAAVVNGSRISIYINGTLDGKLETGPPDMATSTADVIIGAYQSTLRGDERQSNLFSGIIDDATIYEYSMVDWEIKEEYEKSVKQYTNFKDGITTFTLFDGIQTVDSNGISPELMSIPNDSIITESLSITEDILLNLNGISIIPVQEYLVLSDNLTLTLNQQNTKVNSTSLSQTLTLTDNLYLKLNGTVYSPLEESLLLSETILLLLNNQTVLFSNSTSRLTHGTIEIGKIVNWTQTVLVNNTEDLSNVLVELPADAQNIQIHKSDENGTATEIPQEEIVIISPELEPVENEYDIPRPKEMDLSEVAKEHDIRNVVPLDYAALDELKEIKQKDKPTKALLINYTNSDVNATENIIPQNYTQQNQTEYTVRFQTPAPYAIEDDYSTVTKFQKNVTVAHDSTLHYTDVKSYTDVPEYLVLHNTQFKLYWNINDTKIDVTYDQRFNVTFADADGNGTVDRMEWNVPKLSEQEFGVEADITIINVQSYPVVGGNWTVYFNTTGTADLTITSIMDTTFGNNLPDDLKFLELNNGTHTLYPIINLTANTITYHNYTSNYTGFEASKVLTPGDHHLMFTFGTDTGFAHNFAKVENLKIATGRFAITGGTGNQAITGIGFQPKAYILISTTGTTDDINGTNSRLAIGMTDGSGSFCMSSGEFDNLGTSDVGRRGTTGLVLCSFDVNGTQANHGRASHVSMNTDGFTINKRTAFSTPAAPLVNYIAFGGSDLQAYADTVNLHNTVGSSVDVTAPNFQPDLVLTSYIGNMENVTGDTTNNNNTMSFGWAINPSIQAANNQYSVMIASQDSQSQPDSYTEVSNQYAGLSHTLGVRDAAYEINSFDAQGFSVTTRNAAASDSNPVEVMGYLALDMGSNPKIYSMDTTARTSTGSISYTGSGFKPTFLLGIGSATATSFNTVTAGGSLAIGITNGTHTNAIAQFSEDVPGGATLSDSASRVTNTQFWSAPLHTGGTEYEATFTSFNNNGWTLNYGDAAGTANYRQAFLAIATIQDAFMMPDAAAPGMNIAVQIIGSSFNQTDVITTNSSSVVVGPKIVTDTSGNKVSTNGNIIQTTLFISTTATSGAVEILINGVPLRYPFNIINTVTKFTGTGNYTGKTGSFILGNNQGINGNRTLSGTIVLDSLIVPATVTLTIDTSDIDLTLPGNQGYLPATIIVDGPVNIQGILNVSGKDGGHWNTRTGGDGGPGGGGGGGGGKTGPNAADDGGNGGAGFAGGGAGGTEGDTGDGGIGGTGTGISGNSPGGSNNGGNGGYSLYQNHITNGTGGADQGAGGAGGAGGSGWPFGSGGNTGTYSGGETTPTGIGGGGGGGSDDDPDGGGGGGFGTAGEDANGVGRGNNERGAGGSASGNNQLVPLGGGSGGGGGAPDEGGDGRSGGGGGGGGGALLIYSNGNLTLSGSVLSKGGRSGSGGNDGTSDLCCGGTAGGGGSGGAIVLQSRFVTTGSGTLSVVGGPDSTTCATCQVAPTGTDGGYGGDGRLRVDGLPKGVTAIQGTTPSGQQGPPTKFVGPAITKISGNEVNGTAAANAKIQLWIQDGTNSKNFNTTASATGVWYVSLLTKYYNGTNYITAIQNTTNTNHILSSAASATLHMTKKSIVDTVNIDDAIFPKVKRTISPDTVAISDSISFRVFVSLRDGTRLDSLATSDTLFAFTSKKPVIDEVKIDDAIFPKVKRTISPDIVAISDSISFRVFVSLRDGTRLDSLATSDTLFAFTSKKPVIDEVKIDDAIFPKVKRTISPDTVAISDSISFRVFVSLRDGTRLDSLATSDTLFAFTSKKPVIDEVGINDYISVALIKYLEDSATINDFVSFRVFVSLRDGTRLDSLATSDTLFAFTSKKPVIDEVGINDYISVALIKYLEDSATINDFVSFRVFVSLRDGTRLDSLATSDTLFAFTSKKPVIDEVGINDYISVALIKYLEDTAVIDDSISARVFVTISDQLTINDEVGKLTSVELFDNVVIDDHVTSTILKDIEDTAVIDDSISARVFVTISDQLTINDEVGKLTSVELFDNVVIDDHVTSTILKDIEDTAVIDDSISARVFVTISDQLTINDEVGKLTSVELFDNVVIDDHVTSTILKDIEDTAVIDDSISARVFVTISDQLTINDEVGKLTSVELFDNVVIDDHVTSTILKDIEDTAVIDDSISARVFVTISDQIVINDLASTDADTSRFIEDGLAIDDYLTSTILKDIEDTAVIDDSISARVFVTISDQIVINDLASTDADTSRFIEDGLAIDDYLTSTILKDIEDSAVIDDSITTKILNNIHDEIALDDAISFRVFVKMSDEMTTNDVLGKIIHVDLFDTVGIDDSIITEIPLVLFSTTALDDAISFRVFVRMSDEMTTNDVLGKIIHVDLFDTVGIDDSIITEIPLVLFSTTALDDSISFRVFVKMSDEMTTNDVLGKIIHVDLFDTVGIDDSIITEIPLALFSTTALDDAISFRVFVRMSDEMTTFDEMGKLTRVDLFDTVGIDDSIITEIPLALFSTTALDDAISFRVFVKMSDEMTTFDEMGKLTRVDLFDTVGIDDSIITEIPLVLFSTTALDDAISFRVFVKMSDEMTTFDEMGKLTRVELFDGVLIDDIHITKVPLALFSTTALDDAISFRVFVKMSDEMTTDDLVTVKIIILILDEMIIDDTLFALGRKLIEDSLLTDEQLSAKSMYNLFDDVTIDDEVNKNISIESLFDGITIDDLLVKKIAKTIEDSLLVDDQTSHKSMYRLFDVVAGIEGRPITAVHLNSLFDGMGIADAISTTNKRFMFDSLLVDDKIYTKAMYRLYDELFGEEGRPITAVHLNSIADGIGIDDFITTKTIFRRSTQDDVGIDDQISIKAMYRLSDDLTSDDYISIRASMSIFDGVTIDDELRSKTIKPIEDSLLVNDQIYSKAMYRLSDDLTSDDYISIRASMSIFDGMIIDEQIRIKADLAVEDTILVDDQISIKAMYMLFESVTTDDQLSFKAMSRLSDNIGLDDVIFAKSKHIILDGVTMDDTISKKAMYRLFDEVVMADGTPLLAVLLKSVNDVLGIEDVITKKLLIRKFTSSSIGIEDTISKRVFYTLSDGMTINDMISKRGIKSIYDEVGIVDSISTSISYGINIEDLVGIEDSQIISIAYGKTIVDTITTDDTIQPSGLLDIQTRDNNDNLVPLYSYRIIPGSTGTGWQDITDGGPDDYDGLPNGKISVFVPLGTYRINQTAVPLGWSSVINFTYATVHPLDMNATALFRVFDPLAISPEDLNEMDSDILDIADNGFDDLLSGIQLVKVNNGTQVIINKTSEMPAPMFAGANNATAISNATASQSTLLYKNLALPSNDSPENIIAAFRQTPYDSGNYTQTAFVGVMAATEPASRQYIATQPFDKFNCGQQYLYSIDETLIPAYGGMVEFNLTLNAAGICPDAQDYLTFEVAQTPPAGTPVLSDQDTLLYINPQYPRISTTGIGVDFRDSSNIDSFTFALISPLPETGLINDLTVYLQAGAVWNTAGVTEISKNIISTGPNAGKVEIILSVDHLAKMIVGGKIIPPPPPPPPIPFGFGDIRIGPSSLGGAAPEMPTARIHRVEYDVCNENISRILVGHDGGKPPLIQLLTTKSGVINAKLAVNQPFADQNKFTLVDRYLFEAPLAPGESIFTIFAVDYHSNVQRTLVQIEGCEGVLVFVDDQIVLPHIFDIKYKTQNGTDIRPATEYHYINEGQDMTVSAIVQSPIIPLGKAELFFTILSTGQQKVIPMDISPLILPDLENVSIISGIISDNLLEGPAVEYWIRIVTEEGVIQESVHNIVGVKPEGYSGESSAEMDTITIKAQGTTLKPTTYLTNEGDIPVYSEVSLIADGKKVYSKPVLLTPGQNMINLEWSIPKTGSSTSYKIQTQLDVYDKSFITGMATLDTFVRTKTVSIYHQSDIVPATDELGNIIARPAMMYSSNEGSGMFRVVSPDGTCVIGAGCLVEESTLKHRGGIDSVLIDGHIYRVRYSGENSPLERFSITSLDSVLGEWNVQIVENSQFIASAAEDVPIKVQYRAERSPMVTVGME